MYTIKRKTWKKWVNCLGPMVCFNNNRILKLPTNVLLSREKKQVSFHTVLGSIHGGQPGFKPISSRNIVT